MPTRFLALCAVLGCGRQVGPVTPGDALYYQFADRYTLQGDVIYVYRSIKDGTEVLVGAPIEVDGVFAASCSYSTTPLGKDGDESKWPREIRACKEQPTDVVVSCQGACTVVGKRVTPTAPGKLTVAVTLTSRETSERAAFSHEVVAVEAEDFELGCDLGPVAATSGAPCRTRGRPNIRIRAGQGTFAAQIVANGKVFKARRDGAKLELAEIVGSAPTSVLVPAPGEYVIALGFGSLRRVVTFEVTD